jgi:hypothetical protein
MTATYKEGYGGLAQPFTAPPTKRAPPSFSAVFAERVGAIFPIWNWARCPYRFLLDPRLHFR